MATSSFTDQYFNPSSLTPLKPQTTQTSTPMSTLGVKAAAPAVAAPVAPTLKPAQTSPIQTSTTIQGGTGTTSNYLPTSGGTTGTTQTGGQTNPIQPQQDSQYAGLIGQLIAQSQNAQQAQQMSPAEVAARQAEGQLTNEYGTKESQLERTPGLLTTATGRESALRNQFLNAQGALGQQVQGYAAERQASAAGAQAGLTGLNYAAGYSQPQLTQPGQTFFNPLTGTFGNGSSAGGSSSTAPAGIDQNAWNQYINDYKQGNYSAIPGSITGNANLSGQLQSAVQAANPNFNYATAAGNAAANQSNAALSGTATPTAYNSIYQQALGDYTNLQQSVQNVDQFGNLLTSNMTSGGINPTDVKYANQTLSQIRSQLSSSAQAQYDTTLAALRSKISGMLSVGGNETPTAITADAQKILDGTLPVSQLSDVLSRIQAEGNILLTTQGQKVNDAKSGTQGSTPGTAGSSGPVTWDNL